MANTQEVTDKEHIELSNAIEAVLAGFNGSLALDALLTNVTWLIVDAAILNRQTDCLDAMVDQMAAQLKQSVRVQMETQNAATH